MSASKLESWIKGIGQTHEELLSKSIIPDDEFIELFPGDDELYIEPEEGVAMSFWTETERYEALCITLMKTMPSTVAYTGELPAPYTLRMNQASVRALFGEPLEYSGPVRMPEPMGQTGGWEYYSLDPEVYPGVKVQFQYLESMEVNCIVFVLIDKGHD